MHCAENGERNTTTTSTRVVLAPSVSSSTTARCFASEILGFADVSMFVVLIQGNRVLLIILVCNWLECRSHIHIRPYLMCTIAKKKVFFAPIRCDEINLDEILNSFPVTRTSFPVRYLGIPLGISLLTFKEV
jgi:hypothetical protein